MTGEGHTISKEKVEHLIKVYTRDGQLKRLNSKNLKQVCKIINYCLDNQNRKSSPGFPYNQIYRTTGEMIDNARDLIFKMVLERFQLLQSADTRGLSAEQLVAKGFMDPIKLFIKNEPHRQDKIESGRLRNIFSVSIVDRIVQMVICTLQNQWEIQNWTKLPSKPGFGFTAEKVEKFVESLSGYPDHKPSDYTATDVKSWDWNVTDDDFSFEAYVRWRLEGGITENINLYRNVFYVMARKLVVLSNGRALAQIFPGIMPSGGYFTTSSNCRIRAKVGLEYGSRLRDMAIMGDDSIEKGHIDLSRSSRVFKGIQQFHDSVEFCSHQIYFGNGVKPRAEPMNVKKMLYSLYSDVGLPPSVFIEKLIGVRMVLKNRTDLVEIIHKIKHLPYASLLLSSAA